MSHILEKTIIGVRNLSFYSPKLDLDDFQAPENFSNPEASEASTSETDTTGTTSNFRCILCSYQGESREEQISHYQSGWHVQNLRRKLAGKEALTEEEFDDEDRDDEGESDLSDDDEDVGSIDEKRSLVVTLNKSGPRILFPSKSSDQIFSVYKCVLNDSTVPLVARLEQSVADNHWAIILVTGGRFAAAIFEGSEPTVHKTFHRYTVRAGQGGAQGSRDSQNAQRAPKSAGAGLRRYNEAALAKEIQELLAEWSKDLRNCSKIFMRFSTYHRNIFFGGAQPPFGKDDSRIETIPFPAGKATFDEVKHIQRKLSTIYCHGSPDDIRNLLEAKRNKQSLKKSVAPTKKITEVELPDHFSSGDEELNKQTRVSKVKKTKEAVKELKKLEEKALPSVCAALRQDLFTACKTENIVAIRTILSGVPELERNYLINEVGGAKMETFLHRAATDGLKSVIPVLMELGASPLVLNADGKFPYQVGKDRETKMVFRKYREDHEKQWDWERAQIPLPLSPEEEKQREEKNAEKNRIAKQARKERIKIKKAEEMVKRKEEEERNRYLTLSDREKRALAAEKRLRESAASTVTTRCFLCAADMTAIIPFEYSSNIFCTMNCLKKHKESQRS